MKNEKKQRANCTSIPHFHIPITIARKYLTFFSYRAIIVTVKYVFKHMKVVSKSLKMKQSHYNMTI